MLLNNCGSVVWVLLLSELSDSSVCPNIGSVGSVDSVDSSTPVPCRMCRSQAPLGTRGTKAKRQILYLLFHSAVEALDNMRLSIIHGSGPVLGFCFQSDSAEFPKCFDGGALSADRVTQSLSIGKPAPKLLPNRAQQVWPTGPTP